MTITWGELKKAWARLPDDAQVFIDEGDLQMYDVSVGVALPPVLDHPWLVTLEMGQVWNYEVDFDARLDAAQASGLDYYRPPQ